MAYLPPNQPEIPLLAFEALSSTLRSISSIFLIVSALVPLAYASASLFAFEYSLFAVET